MPNTQSRSETAEKISVLLRIYRAAVTSGDDALRRATAKQLSEHGVDVAAMAGPESKGGQVMLTPVEIDQLADAVADRVAIRLAGRVDADALLDVHGAAELLSCSVPTVERLTAAGELPSLTLHSTLPIIRSRCATLNCCRISKKSMTR